MKQTHQEDLTVRQKRFLSELPKAKTLQQAAISAGYSKKSAAAEATRLLKNEKIKKKLKESFEDNGLSDEEIAVAYNKLVYYNLEEVKRVTGEGRSAREIEEMRNAQVANSALANVVKFKGSSEEDNTKRIDININHNTALLASKQLLKRLQVEQLKELQEEIERLLSEKATQVNNTIESV